MSHHICGIGALRHRLTREHYTLVTTTYRAVVCAPRHGRRPSRFFVQAGAADWVELDHDRFVSFTGAP